MESNSDPVLHGVSGLQEQQNEDDVIEHLSKTETLEMLEFDPKVALEEKWVLPIPETFAVFWTRAHLLGTVAGNNSANSCTTDITTPGEVRTSSILSNSPVHPRNSPSSNSREQFGRCRYTMHFKQIEHRLILYSLPPVTTPGSQTPLLLSQLVQGCLLELTSTPFQRGVPCPLINQHQPAVEEEVQKLLAKGTIRKVEPCPGQFISRLFLIAKKDGSFRPVVNLKLLNRYIARVHFKMEGINMLKDLLLGNNWMASIDLKDTYLLVAMKAEHEKYFRFVWAEQTHEFQCLPFGLSSAPRVFTKFLKPVVGLLRQQGIRLVIFLDNMLVWPSQGRIWWHRWTK